MKNAFSIKLNTLAHTALIVALYSSRVMADVDCNDIQEDYQVRVCAQIQSRFDILRFNIDLFIYLRSLDPQKECTRPEDYIPLLLIYENSYLLMKTKQCDLQLATSHNHFYTKGANCDIENAEGDLLAHLKKSNISPFDCELPSHTEIIAHNASLATIPSFNCMKASTLSEKAICSNKPLSQIDLYLSLIYQEAIKRYPRKKDKILFEQQEFLKHRELSCQQQDDSYSCNPYYFYEHIIWLESQFTFE